METLDKENWLIADLHIHSRFSRATSKDTTIDNLEKYAQIKGVNLLGTGDFQHPFWKKELDTLEERQGILYTKNNFPFIWQTEISLMYTQNGKGRRIHHIILAPNKEVVAQIISFLSGKGRLDYDGRPIFGFSSIELVDEFKKISDDIEIIPAHCMTPWFGIFGSKSGFNNLKECFQEKTNKVCAIESGMSADPEMLRNFSWLNDKSIVSFSDLHSFWPWRIGRESTIFNINSDNLNYNKLIKQIRENSFITTIETEPAYGRYHWDGHRLCNFSCSPEQSKKLNNICPVCNRALTIGVENRIEELADQSPKIKNNKPYYKLIPLHELIAFAKSSALSSKSTWAIYNQLIQNFGNEFNILLNVSEDKLTKSLPNDHKLIKIILDNRKGNLTINPGFDGEYGKIIEKESQKTLV